MSTHPDLEDLRSRLQVIEARVQHLVATRRSDDPDPDDPFRGLYITDEGVDRLLAQQEHGGGETGQVPMAGGPRGTALHRLAQAAVLDDLDVELLLIVALPDLDSRFERLYGYLNDDVTRRRATIGLAMQLAGLSPLSHAARRRLSSLGPLSGNGLVLVEDEDRPFLTRALRVPDRVTAHLVGEDSMDPGLSSCVIDPHPYRTPLTLRLTRALRGGTRLLHLREQTPGTALSTAAAALAQCDHEVVALDLARMADEPDPVMLSRLAVREALLRGGGLAAGPVEALAEAAPGAVHRFTAESPVPVILVGAATWDPRWSEQPPLSIDVPPLSPQERHALWQEHLGADGHSVNGWGGHLSLGPGQVAKAVRSARVSAACDGTSVTTEDLRRGVRGQNAAGLERLSRRIEPDVGWEDLVLAPGVRAALREVAARARHRHTVLTTWRMRRGGGRGLGITAMFAGDSGTGKTMSAEVVAADLGLDLYTINLATVVDKYVGETEKNLERIFTEAAGTNAVLFFDEADAIFGKRSAVRDAHDRYANIESAYLLQRLETFDGLAVLATNLRSNVDEAFTRRLDAIIDFPAPTPELRRELWHRCLAPPLPLGDDLDLDFCAGSFELAGGNIRSACITAAYLAAAGDRPVGMAQVVTAIGQEYRKLGRLVLEREFGDYLALIE